MEKNKPTEDDGIIYDYELDWKPCNSGSDKRITYVNDKLSSLFRVVDLERQKIIFSDVNRIMHIKDVNKILSNENNEDENKKRYLPLINRIVDDTIPITMPYKPQELTCYIEAFPGFDKNFDDTLGILFVRENGPIEALDDMTPVKRFFRILPVGANYRYEEISHEIYVKVKEKWFKEQEKK